MLSPTPSRDLLPALLEKPLHLGSRAPARPPCFPPFYGEESARSLSLSPSLPPSLPPSLSLFALLCSGHGVKAGPPPRSPHPDILRGWAWLYRGKTLKGNEEKRRVPGRQQKHALITGPANLVLAAAALHLSGIKKGKEVFTRVSQLKVGVRLEGGHSARFLSRVVRGKVEFGRVGRLKVCCNRMVPGGACAHITLCKHLHFSITYRSALAQSCGCSSFGCPLSAQWVPSFCAVSSIWVATLSTCCARFRRRGGSCGSATFVYPGTGAPLAGRASFAAVEGPEALAAPAFTGSCPRKVPVLLPVVVFPSSPWASLKVAALAVLVPS